MIVPMKKIHIIVQAKDIVSALENLRQVGTVHVEHQENLAGEKIEILKKDLKEIHQVVEILKDASKNILQEHCPQWKEKITEIMACLSQKDSLREDMENRRSLIAQWQSWGDFNPQDIKALEDNGMVVKFYEMTVTEISNLPEDVYLIIAAQEGAKALCVLISRRDFSLQHPSLILPPLGLNDLLSQQKHDADQMRNLEKQIMSYAKYTKAFEEALKFQEDMLRFEETAKGMKKDSQIAYLKGFIPAFSCASLEKDAQEKKWGLFIEDPSDEDKVPTLLKNPKWVELVKPVFQMISILPGYKEVDISLFFFLFFTLFFAILMGDAGYASLLLLATFWFHKKASKTSQNNKPFILLYILNGAALIWGLLGGTFFGQALFPQYIKPLWPWITNSINFQVVCFLIGAVHLSIAHIWKIILKFPSISFLSDAGWLLLIWGMFFLAKELILSIAMPPFVKMIFIVGALLVIFFTSPRKNPLKAIGPGLGGLALNIVNTFTDVVSYIRLFAIGLASVAVADAFNEMALQFGFDAFFSGMIAVVILVIGHFFNIILGVLSVAVHGLRLNVLEFSNHLSLEWSGFAYQPFRKISKHDT